MRYRDFTRTGGLRRLAAIGALLAGIAAGAIFAPASAAARVPARALDSAGEFGVNTGVMFNSGRYTRAQIDAQLAALADTGATVVRSDALWEDSEPQPPIGILHRYNWTLDDLIVGSLASHGLRWLPIIDYAPPWARIMPSRIHSAPASVSDFATYAASLASRYGPGGTFWLANPGLKPLPVSTYEVWNEPDNPVFWAPSPNPGAYASLYSAARGAILSKQTGARVIVGGLMQPVWFLESMLADDPGVASEIDGVAIHPYASTPDRVFTAIRAARLAMRADGLGSVPLYVTEVGWTTHGQSSRDFASENVRPGYISSTITTLAHTDCGIAGVYLYAWTTPERNPANPQDWFGISPPGAGGSADVAAFTSALEAAAAPAPPALLCTTDPALVDTRVLPPPTRQPRPLSRGRGAAARPARRRCRPSSKAKWRLCRRSLRRR